jgi:AcrR family transcriptional regulator
MTAAGGRRPANRPSRRAGIVSAAADLFALQAPELVTVSNIADRAGMTSAAFYYHFTSKEELLEELVSEFAQEWISAANAVVDGIADMSQLDRLINEVLDWMDEHEQVATVFFLAAVGATAGVDRTRQDTRNALIQALSGMLRRIAPACKAGQVEVAAVSLTSLFNTAARSRLALDDVFRTLGPTKFRAEVTAVARNIVGPAPAPRTRRPAAKATSRVTEGCCTDV